MESVDNRYDNPNLSWLIANFGWEDTEEERGGWIWGIRMHEACLGWTLLWLAVTAGDPAITVRRCAGREGKCGTERG